MALSTAGRSAIVLADGREERLIPKRFSSEAGESSLLEYVLDSVWTVADELLIVFRQEPTLELVESIAPFGVKILIQDGTLVSRVESGFMASRSEHCLVVEENRPFVKPNVVFALFDAARGSDAAVPRWANGTIEPMLSVYRRQSALKVASQVTKSDTPLTFVDHLYVVRFVQVEGELGPLDPELNSFFKVNDTNDLKKAISLATVGKI